MQQVQPHEIDRAAAVAGRFYPSSKAELNLLLTKQFRQAAKLANSTLHNDEELRALVVPHAGYIFSGVVAASAFNYIKKIKGIKRIFLLGCSHYATFEGASIYNRGDYHTPLGKVMVDREVANKLLQSGAPFQFHPEAHLPEHSLEVQLPFLQYLLSDSFSIVPILMGTKEPHCCASIAYALESYFREENLFIISTDFSHYPSYSDAQRIDADTVHAIQKNNPETFLHQLEEHQKVNLQNFSTGICGWNAMLTLLYITRRVENISFQPILYRNSGDADLNDEKSRVVGYQSMAIVKTKMKV